MTTVAVPTAIDHYLAAAPDFVARVAEAADRIDAERQLPPDLAADLADAGFFRLLLPRELGGAELAHPDFLEILETFAGADASVAWCLNQNNVFSTRSTRMHMTTAREIWGEPRAVVTNGPPAAGSKSAPTRGGFRLSGHWNFSSGSDHATWIAALAPVIPENGAGVDGQPPQTRLHLMPIDQVRLVDLWQVAGLRGTGSFSFQVDDLLVPEERTFVQEGPSWCDRPLYGIPTTLLFATGFATVAFGSGAQEPGHRHRRGRQQDALSLRRPAPRPSDHAAHYRRGSRAAELGPSLPQGGARPAVGVGLRQGDVDR